MMLCVHGQYLGTGGLYRRVIWPIRWEIPTYFEVLFLSLVREELSCLLPGGCEPGSQGSERQVEGGGWQSHHSVCGLSHNCCFQHSNFILIFI